MFIMKRIFAFVLIMLLVIPPVPVTRANGVGWTWVNPLPQGNELRAVYGTSSRDVYAAGLFGTILHYDGREWTTMPNVPTREDLLGIWPAGPNAVFAVGDNVLLRYDGTQWTTMSPPSILGPLPFTMRDVWGTSANNVYAVGTHLFHYDGTRWQLETTAYTASAIWGSGPSDIFTVGNQGTISHYNGSTWTPMPSNTLANLFDVWGSGPNDVYAVGTEWNTGDGVITHYDGHQWNVVFTTEDNGFVAVWGTGPTDVYALGDWGEVYHYDGTRWQKIDKIWPLRPHGLWGAADGTLFTVGANGAIYGYRGGVWSPQFRGTTFDLNAAWSGGQQAAIGGDAGIVYLFDGTRWRTTRLPGDLPADITSLWGVAGGPLFATANDFSLYRYESGAWQKVDLGLPSSNVLLNGVWGSAPDDIYAVGGHIFPQKQTVLHYDGLRWTTVFTTTGPLLEDVWGSGPNNVYAVGDEGTLLHYDGRAWQHVSLGTDTHFYAVWGSGPRDVFVVGGKIYHFDGTRWQQMDPGDLLGWLFDVWGYGPNDVYVVGQNSTLLHYDGSTWRAVDMPTNHVLYAVADIKGTLVVAGEGGTVLARGPVPSMHPYRVHVPWVRVRKRN